MPHRILIAGALGLALASAVGADPRLPHHDLRVTLEPADHHLAVQDTISLPEGQGRATLDFRLHAGLAPRVDDPRVQLEKTGPARGSVPLMGYRVSLPAGLERFTLHYAGTIDHPLQGAGDAGGLSGTPGTISGDGVFLSAASGWYPLLRSPDPRLTFALTVTSPDGWQAVSQGQRQVTDGAQRWTEDHPQQDIYLVAAPFRRTGRDHDGITLATYLRGDEPALARRYLDAAGPYLDMYQRLIGDYPYRKFALVENFWDSGYGMPSFTLMGPRIIRFPFIIYTSFPHEILHNWWGNGVYVDYAGGNWSEGLTAYLSDHLLRAQRGEATAYRRTTLQQYADFAANGRDFPLTRFQARHSSASQAVGYGKTLMFFHMLRRRLGDAAFSDGLRRLYRDNRFRQAGFDDVRQAFEVAGDTDLGQFFNQWVTRTGAPALTLEEARMAPGDGRNELVITLRQRQPGPAYALDVPLALTLEGQQQAAVKTVAMGGKRQTFRLPLAKAPLSVAVDPAFDLFRRLDPSEIPPALSQLFGAERPWYVLPAAAPEARRKAYRRLIAQWGRSGADTRVVRDDELEALPEGGSVWLLGWDNRFRGRLGQALSGHPAAVTKDYVELEDRRWSRGQAQVVITASNPNGTGTLGWIAAEPAALPGLARKLPHYSKYSYLVFRGEAPDNVLKGQWRVTDSTMSRPVVQIDGQTLRVPSAALPPRAPLIRLKP